MKNLHRYLAHVRRREDGSFAIHELEDHLRAVGEFRDEGWASWPNSNGRLKCTTGSSLALGCDEATRESIGITGPPDRIRGETPGHNNEGASRMNCSIQSVRTIQTCRLGFLLFFWLYGVTALSAEDLGNLSANPFDPDSTSNQFGRYGSPFSPDSVNNPFGAGSPYRFDSQNNSYGKGLWIEDAR